MRDPEWESGLKVINFSRVGDASRADITPYLYSELIERLEGGEFGSWRDGDARRERMHSELVLLSDIHPILREIPDYRFLEVLYSDPDLFSGWGVDNPKRETLEALEEISIEGHVSATERLAYLSGLRGLLKEIKSQSNIANSFTITPEQQERYNDLIQIHSRAIEHRVALIVQLTNHIIETGGSFSLSGIARNDNATPFSNSIENALNAVLRDRAGLADSVLRPIYGVPSGFLYQCDIDWCYALGGMGQFRIVSQSKPDCVLLSEGRSRCEFRYHMNFKQLISITQNHPLTDLVNSASRLADETEATAEFVYEDGVWHLAGAIE